jgi:hypothetical protein
MRREIGAVVVAVRAQEKDQTFDVVAKMDGNPDSAFVPGSTAANPRRVALQKLRVVTSRSRIGDESEWARANRESHGLATTRC